jgi:rhodanese-related sulfurtransferase
MKHIIFSILLFGSTPLMWAEDVIETVHEAPNDIPEQKNIIPDGDERGKSVVAPTDRMVPKTDPYEAAQAEVIKALSLYNDGKMEAASDKALEAYEDLRALPRKVKRAKRVELKKLIDANGKKVNLIDVREPYEYDISRIEGAKLIPLGQLMDRVSELDSSKDYVVHCRSGARSAKAILQLQKIGFKKLKNLKGGINAWADVDPTVAKY